MIKNTIIKRISAAVLAALLIASGPVTIFAAQDEAIEDNPEEIIAPDPETGYIDVHRSDWFCDAIFWAVEHNVASGTREYCFSPEMTITRAQAVTMFWNYSGRPQVQNPAGRFSDVAEGSWYENAVSWAVDANVAAGTGSGTFSPDKQCSRAEFITLLWAYCGATYTNGLSDFDDVPNGAYYRQAAVWAD
ncbi:MAG: S-layer homology domain-containing protein, partial [Clostridia bacterium]|nr:S-layer homology domain-containing protein [Clostridia bacterium]